MNDGRITPDAQIGRAPAGSR